MRINKNKILSQIQIIYRNQIDLIIRKKIPLEIHLIKYWLNKNLQINQLKILFDRQMII
jgi:hypothetical protein